MQGAERLQLLWRDASTPVPDAGWEGIDQEGSPHGSGESQITSRGPGETRRSQIASRGLAGTVTDRLVGAGGNPAVTDHLVRARGDLAVRDRLTGAGEDSHRPPRRGRGRLNGHR